MLASWLLFVCRGFFIDTGTCWVSTNSLLIQKAVPPGHLAGGAQTSKEQCLAAIPGIYK